MKIIKKIALALLVLFVLMQFYRPEKNISQGDHAAVFYSETNPPEGVKTILMASCFDCHSDNTEYPWYNNVAPVSYWLADHIEHGKGHLNFSDWEGYDVKEKEHKLEEVVEMVGKGEMPLKEYTWTHYDARLTDGERDAIKQWAEKTRTFYQLKLQSE